MANPAAIYGAMLAGVDYVLVGAGLPTEIPQLPDALAEHRPARLSVAMHGAAVDDDQHVKIHPSELLGGITGRLRRPRLLAIVSFATLARYLAGAQSSPQHLTAATAAGATGIQVGTAFALCRESGLDGTLKRRLLRAAVAQDLPVRNDVRASPTGFPFKLASLSGTAAAEDVYVARPRLCDLGYLRSAFRRPDGTVGYRCPAEPVEEYVRKGGAIEDTQGSRCLCNGRADDLHPVHQVAGELTPTSSRRATGLAQCRRGTRSHSGR